MNALRRMADGLLGRFAPKVTASAGWYYQYRCILTKCAQDPGGWTYQRRNCYDSTGFCYPWQNYGCC